MQEMPDLVEGWMDGRQSWATGTWEFDHALVMTI
jgi:hypothetical protein